MLSDAKFWVLVAFVTFFALLGKKLWKFATGSLDARSARIAEELATARRLREEAEAVLASYRKKQKECLAEAESIVEKAREDAAAMARAAEADLKAALDARTKLAMEKIEQEEARAMQEVQHHVVDIALAAARELIVEHLSKMPADELVKRAVADIERKLH